MNDIRYSYSDLFRQFLSKKISAEEFQMTYLNRFKSETRMIDENLFYLLDCLFGDVDSFTSDQLLIAENPAFYINEEGLREKVKLVLDRLSG